MKYAITTPRGRIIKVLDESNDRTLEITDEEASLVEAGRNATPPVAYGIDSAEEFRLFSKIREERRLALLSPEQRAAQQAFDIASAAFKSLPLGKQAFWEPVRAKVGEAILEGDMASAVEILTTIPTLYDGMEDDRTVFLALFGS